MTLRAKKQPTPAALSRDASKRETREALIGAALELFAAEGLDGPSLDAICERAGYTRGAFYVHFPDRDALLVAAMEKVGESFLARVFEHVTGKEVDPDEGAEDMSEAEFRGLVSSSGTELTPEPPSSSVTTLDPAPVPPAAPRSTLAEVVERFVDAVAAGAYPLMPPSEERSPSRRARNHQVHVRPHQLLDACARSPVVRERYRSLVEGSVGLVADLVATDQSSATLRRDVDAYHVGTLVLATIIGAQTMAELGVPMDTSALGRTLVSMLSPRMPSTIPSSRPSG